MQEAPETQRTLMTGTYCNEVSYYISIWIHLLHTLYPNSHLSREYFSLAAQDLSLTNQTQKTQKEDLASPSIIYTLFLNCLYLLFICCSCQHCSGEMATNDGDRLATTGLLQFTHKAIRWQPSPSCYFSVCPIQTAHPARGTMSWQKL